MDDRPDLLSNRSKLAQTLYGLSGRQLIRFRELFPTPIHDTLVETALFLAMGYPKKDQDPKPRKDKKKMHPR